MNPYYFNCATHQGDPLTVDWFFVRGFKSTYPRCITLLTVSPER